jgi:hypothetical protein
MASEWTIETLKEHFDALRAADAIALQLQASKYEDRLIKLNGEHTTLAQMKDTYLPREVYERDVQQARHDREAQVVAMNANRRTILLTLGVALVGWALTAIGMFVTRLHP